LPDAQTFADIAAVVRTYVEGMCLNDPANLCEAMHEKSCIIGHSEGGLEWGTREAFIGVVDKATEAPDPSPWHAINAMSVVGDAAVVQAENIFLGQHYDDTLTLPFHQNRWVIVSKAFVLRPAG